MIRAIAFIGFILIYTTSNGQFAIKESVCDTLIENVHYKHCVKNWHGNLIAFGNRNADGQKHGPWIYFKNGWTKREEGSYVNGIKVGLWWVSDHSTVHYDVNGRISAKGSGCRDCPPF